jgi:hypothetical protein
MVIAGQMTMLLILMLCRKTPSLPTGHKEWEKDIGASLDTLMAQEVCTGVKSYKSSNEDSRLQVF